VPPQPPPAGVPAVVPPAQDPQHQDEYLDPRVRELQGKQVKEIRVQRYDRGRMVPVAGEVADRVLRMLVTRSGKPLDPTQAKVDVENLWSERRLKVDLLAMQEGAEVVVTILILDEDQVYERVEFRGLRSFERKELEELIGIYPDRQITTSEAIAMRNIMLAHYHRAGYAFCNIDNVESDPEGGAPGDRPRKLLTFRIDEGLKVTVDRVSFRGNVSFPGDPPFGLFNPGDFLSRSSHIQSASRWAFIRGGPYSREIIEEDIDRLRLFYRGKGFLDAMVELVDPKFSADRTEVDLEFLVVEGPRYRIKDVRIVHTDQQGKPVPASAVRYQPEEIIGETKVRPGDFYDHDRIRRDIKAIQDFYGKRGHPAKNTYSLSLPDAYFLFNGWPQERYTEDARVELTFRVAEGQPKTLREVLIRGNTFTRDRVIRRKVYVRPGDRVDMTQVERSVRYLNNTRFFTDPVTLAGPRFELLKVDGHDDLLDLAIDLKEGATGEFRWGVGISTGAGANALIEFKKKNFDLLSLPSSPNPITALGEMIDNRAFHGGGQTLDITLSPGTQFSYFQVSFVEPDLFGDQIDTIELRLNGRRSIRRFSRAGFTADTFGGEIGLARNFTEEWSVGGSFRQETVQLNRIVPDAPLNVFAAEGQTEMRVLSLQTHYRDVDDIWRPTSGVDCIANAELFGGFLGGEQDGWKTTLVGHAYLPLHENEAGHRIVLHLGTKFDVAGTFGTTTEVFPTERFFLGGGNLRGFDFQGAGPSQFGRPVGGQAQLTGTAELGFPLVPTRLDRELRDRELIRGLLFSDAGFSGLLLDDPTFRQLRLSVGFGIRIDVPVLDVPIELDLGWPLLFEQTDNRRQFFFTVGRF